jgi:hypothetical protein
MSREPASKKKKPVASLPQPEQRQPKWVTDMHDYYQKTGLYRAADLKRILGDPGAQLIGQSADGLLIACAVPKK